MVHAATVAATAGQADGAGDAQEAAAAEAAVEGAVLLGLGGGCDVGLGVNGGLHGRGTPGCGGWTIGTWCARIVFLLRDVWPERRGTGVAHRARAGRLRRMSPSARPTPARLDPFPLAATLEALERWQQDPSTRQLEVLRSQVEGVLAVAGARGAVLEVCAPPLRTVIVGAGSLTAVPHDDERTGLARYLLGSHEGHTTLARLFLDAPDEARGPVVRGLELVVDAAWSRAEVHGRAKRLAALEAATRAVAAELDIDRVLAVIVDRVRDLVGARFSALGVADAGGRIERFITSGISPEGRAAIGAAPRGHGLLGAIIRDGPHRPRRGHRPGSPQATGFLPITP